MNWSDDSQIESKIREDLYYGNVEGALALLYQIESNTLREELRQVIREYERSA